MAAEHQGPGFTQRPEIPEDRRRWSKPWVNRRGRALRPASAWIVGPPRGRIHDPERTAAKRRRARLRQGKEHR